MYSSQVIAEGWPWSVLKCGTFSHNCVELSSYGILMSRDCLLQHEVFC